MIGDQAAFHEKGGTPMTYVGIDYHKKYSHVTAIDEESSVSKSSKGEAALGLTGIETSSARPRTAEARWQSSVRSARSWGNGIP